MIIAARRAEFDFYQEGPKLGADRFVGTPDAVIVTAAPDHWHRRREATNSLDSRWGSDAARRLLKSAAEG
jgi:hypothetical protein